MITRCTKIGVGLALLLLTAEVTLQITTPSADRSWTDRPLVRIEHLKPSPTQSLSSFQLAVFELNSPGQSSLPPDQTFAAALGRMISPGYTGKREAQLKSYDFSIHPSAQVPDIAQRWQPDALVLVVDDFKLFHTLNIFPPEQTTASRIKILSIAKSFLQNRRSLASYRSQLLSSEMENRWGVLLEKIANVSVNAKRTLLLIPPTHKFYQRKEFQHHHRLLASIAEKHGFSIVDLTPKFTELPSMRISSDPNSLSEMSEIAHRICAEALYEELHLSNVLPKDLAIQGAYRSRSDIRLLESERYDFK